MKETFPTYTQLLQFFRQNSIVKYNNGFNPVINSNVPTLGCTVHFLRSVANRYKHCFAEISALPIHDYFETDMLKGMALVLTPILFAEKRPLICEFAVTLENWAVCDSNVLKPNVEERELYFSLFCEFVGDSRPFVCRYGLVNLLSGYLDSTHIDRIFDMLSNVHYGNYYVDMAAAWLIAEAMVKQRDKTIVFMERNGKIILNNFAYCKALQKMRDSLRISQNDKKWTRSLRYSE